MKNEIQKMLNSRTCRLPFKELDSLISYLGWSLSVVDSKDFPYATAYYLLRPCCEDNSFVAHVNSDEMKKFCYACGYFDIHIDYIKKEIIVYA